MATVYLGPDLRHDRQGAIRLLRRRRLLLRGRDMQRLILVSNWTEELRQRLSTVR
jgi:hypothetical protein